MPIAHVVAFRQIEANRIPFAFLDRHVSARIAIANLRAQMGVK